MTKQNNRVLRSGSLVSLISSSRQCSNPATLTNLNKQRRFKMNNQKESRMDRYEGYTHNPGKWFPNQLTIMEKPHKITEKEERWEVAKNFTIVRK